MGIRKTQPRHEPTLAPILLHFTLARLGGMGKRARYRHHHAREATASSWVERRWGRLVRRFRPLVFLLLLVGAEALPGHQTHSCREQEEAEHPKATVPQTESAYDEPNARYYPNHAYQDVPPGALHRDHLFRLPRELVISQLVRLSCLRSRPPACCSTSAPHPTARTHIGNERLNRA
jgi:hypothetical protein